MKCCAALRIILFFFICIIDISCAFSQQYNFNWNWKFHRGEIAGEPWQYGYDDSNWQVIVVPHNPPMIPGEPDPARPTWESGYSYEGVSWYRKKFILNQGDSERKIFIRFEAVNTVSDVWINGIHVKQHIGGYLPFTADITDFAFFGDSINELTVKADNTDNPEIPIGNVSWFNWGGIYRDVYLVVQDRLHISDPVNAGIVAGGGIFIAYPAVDSLNATISIKTHIQNEYSDQNVNCTLVSEILDHDGNTIGVISQSANIDTGSTHSFELSTVLSNPHLWNPDHPYLYTLRSYVLNETDTVDWQSTTFGIRSIKFTRENGFELNGKVFQFRGANRMQDYPYVGYAMPDATQERDIRLLKEGGFQYLRLSQYPQDPSILDACDRLGVMAMVPIPGFQHIGGSEFKEISYQNMKDMIRRDRNHPCIIAWELSLNETWWTDPDYSPNAHNIGHEEYPGDQCYISGWKDDDIYDIFIATPNAGARSYNGPKPLIISEHGHWQFGGQNSSSDVNRKDGERKMLRQELNHRTSLSQNRALENMCGDGLWSGIDLACYPSGVLDNFRLPKFSYYFWQSQRDPDFISPDFEAGPMIFIANYWKENSPTDIKIYSNCDEVELYRNDQLIERRQPDGGFTNSFISHPPFTFSSVEWEPGELMAIGYIDSLERVRQTVRTPGKPSYIDLEIDTIEYKLVDGNHQILFVYARIMDDLGTLVPDANTAIRISANGPSELVSPSLIQAEAGVATFLLRTGFDPGIINLNVRSKITDIPLSGSASLEILPENLGPLPIVSICEQHDIIQGSENGNRIDIRLWGDQFKPDLSKSNWSMENLPPGVELDTIERMDNFHAILVLKGNSNGSDTDIPDISLSIKSQELLQTDTGSVRSLNTISFKAETEKMVYVTLQVDMTGIDLLDGAFINGEITSEWNFERLYNEGNNIYSITYLLNSGSTTSYCFFTGTSWSENEKETIPAECALKWGTYRILKVPSHDTIIGYTFATCLPVGHATGIKYEIKDPAKYIMVYPNPMDDHIFIESGIPFEKVTISDLTGRILYSEQQTNIKELNLNMAGFKKGTYVLILTYPDHSRKSAIIIK